MIAGLLNFFDVLVATISDVLPIVVIIFGFQLFVLRRRIPNLPQLLIGFVFVIVGLALFLQGLGQALFPIGKLMAEQLTDPIFLGIDSAAGNLTPDWHYYIWVYVFAAAIGFSTAIAEPSLIAVAIMANQVSGGAVSIRGLRVAAAIGVSVGIALGTYRIVSGTPLHYYIIGCYVVVILQTMMTPKSIVALAYDLGGVTTSTVTVPLVTALGLGLASNVPGRNPLLDGFGLIAFACLFPIMSVMAYAQLSEWYGKRISRQQSGSREE